MSRVPIVDASPGAIAAADIAAAAQLACLLEATAPKPGNVSPGRHFGDVRYEDLEVTTEHYRGGHASAASRSGFSISGSSSGGGGGGAFDPRVAEAFLR